MSGEIICDEEGSCKLDTEFNIAEESFPSDLVPLEILTSPKTISKKPRKQIIGSRLAQKVSTKSHSQKHRQTFKKRKEKKKNQKKVSSAKKRGQIKKKIVPVSKRKIIKSKKGKQKTR